MAGLAILIGIYSFLIFGLGLAGKLEVVKAVGWIGLIGMFFLIFSTGYGYRKKIIKEFQEIIKNKVSLLFFGLLVWSIIINFVGALGPEIAFDSLWYHLTIPKIYLTENRIFYIPGGLFYYSAMPKLTEMLYLVSLVFSKGGELAKLIHFSFGLFSATALFILTRRYLKTKQALITTVLFYTTLIVGWESTAGYIDLARTFFEIVAIDLFLQWSEKYHIDNHWRSKSLLIESAVVTGLAISTKLIAFSSLFIFLILVFLRTKRPKLSFIYFVCTLGIVSPWLVFSIISTGNPIFPIFSGILDTYHQIPKLSLVKIGTDFWQLLYHPVDLISPVFLIFTPLVVFHLLKNKTQPVIKWVSFYLLLAFSFWYFTPRTGGSRFILPYLPILAFLFVYVMNDLESFYKKIFIGVIIFSAIINLGCRAVANYKFLKVVAKTQSKQDFLVRNLKFSNGDFFDQNQDIKKIVGSDLVLIAGSHNLFYADFPFVHESYAKKETKFSYVLTQNEEVNTKYGALKNIYTNQTTNVKLYLYGDSVK